jgi:excisionase family DNA binding protein
MSATGATVTPIHRPTFDDLLADTVATAVAHALSAHQPQTAGKGLYRIRDAAQWLSVGETKVREWIDRGALPTVQLDSCVRIRHEDLVTFAAGWVQR